MPQLHEEYRNIEIAAGYKNEISPTPEFLKKLSSIMLFGKEY